MAVVSCIGHQDFRPVIELRYAARGGKEDHGQTCLARIVSELGVDPAHVVVVREDDVVEGVGVEEVVAEHFMEP